MLLVDKILCARTISPLDFEELFALIFFSLLVLVATKSLLLLRFFPPVFSFKVLTAT